MENRPFILPVNVGNLRFDLTRIFGLEQGHDFFGRTDEVPMFSFVIGLPKRLVVVDGMAYIAEEAGDYGVPGYDPPPTLAEQLDALGIDRGQVTDVLLTHAHFDHYGGLSVLDSGKYEAVFPRARHYLGTADWQPQDFDDFDRNTLGLLLDQGLLSLVAGDLDLGDGLMVLAAPGETVGHQMLRLQLDSGVCYFAGDLFHHELELVDWRENVSWADEGLMAGSKTSLMERAAKEEALVYFSHIPGAYQVLRDGQGRFVWRAVVAAE